MATQRRSKRKANATAGVSAQNGKDETISAAAESEINEEEDPDIESPAKKKKATATSADIGDGDTEKSSEATVVEKAHVGISGKVEDKVVGNSASAKDNGGTVLDPKHFLGSNAATDNASDKASSAPATAAASDVVKAKQAVQSLSTKSETMKSSGKTQKTESTQAATATTAQNPSSLSTAVASTVASEKPTPAASPSPAPVAAPLPQAVPSPSPASSEQEQPLAPLPDSSPDETITVSDTLSPAYVGRVIGKGGEMIRDLQARAGCRIDVDQSVPPGHPRLVTYRGKRNQVEFGRRLVSMLCTEGGRDAKLPLGEASKREVWVPANVIGKVIGRGGEMIRELQARSQAKIQVDHSVLQEGQRKISITGGAQAVERAALMVDIVTSNPASDAAAALAQFGGGGNQGQQQKGTFPSGGQPSGPGAPSHRDQHVSPGPGGAAIPPGGHPGAPFHPVPYDSYAPQFQQYGGPGGFPGPHQPYQPMGPQYPYPPAGGPPLGPPGAIYQPTPPLHGGPQGHHGPAMPSMPGEELEYFSCAKMYMGRVIGQRGVTINDLQRRSSTDIQINQDVPPGMDCQISIRGGREGIEAAKAMLREIVDSGPGHPYAGGHGATGTGGLYPNGLPGGPHGTGPAPQLYYQQNVGTQPPYHQPPGGVGNAYAPPPQQYSPPASSMAPNAYVHYPYQQPQAGQYVVQQQQPPAQGQPAQPAVVPPPPSGPGAAPPGGSWKTATAADGQTYYYNEVTGESKWDKPAGML